MRARYWKLTPDEMDGLEYDPGKLINWDIKLTREPEEEAIFIGIFLYRHGTPLNYDSIRGIVYYHNHIERSEIPKITQFLKSRFGGKEKEKGDRVFLEGSDEIYTPKDIAALARDAESELAAKAAITLEFANVSEEELSEAKMPSAKLLPIPGAGR